MDLVTGATGFIGGHIARRLAARGAQLRLLVRPESGRRNLEGLPAEVAVGDLRDAASLRRAVAGCRRVFHAAADYRLWTPRPAEMYASNVEGTRNLLAAAAEAGVERVVYTSTVGTIGLPKGRGLGDEQTPVSLAQMRGHYKRSKFQAEQAAVEFAEQGLMVVIVNPTAPVGERDVKPTPTGKIILDFLCGKMPAFIDTGLNLVDVRDVAEGHCLAGERGQPGERYILGARNMTLEQLLAMLADLTGKPAPGLKLPYRAALAYGYLSTFAAKLTGKPPRAPLEAVRMARRKTFVSSAKAQRELGYQPGGVEEALERAVRWFRENQYC